MAAGSTLLAATAAVVAVPTATQANGTATAPGAPTGVQVEVVDGIARVRWSPPASDGGSAIQHYTVSVPGGCPVTVGSSATEAVLRGLPNSSSVTVSVTAINAAGISAAGSASAAAGPVGYRIVAADGGVFAYGSRFLGSAVGALVAPAVDAVETANGTGYWVVARDGAVYAYGDASYLGGPNAMRLNQPVVSISRTVDSAGYVLASRDGGVFAYGTARFAGSAASLPLQAPIAAIAAHPAGTGYWLAASDGGVFAYGTAGFSGNARGVATAPIVDIEATATGKGYWLLASDGAVYAFGDATYHGGANTYAPSSPAVSITSSGSDRGYAVVTRSGAVYAFGDATYAGGADAQVSSPVVAITNVRPASTTTLQLLQLSDFHGQLDPNSNIGGAGVISTLWKADRAAVPATFTVNSGDNIGAAPPLSSFFDEIPTLQAMNLMGFEVNGFGNHEFDKPLTDLRAQLAVTTAPWVLANHTNVATELPGVKPYVIIEKSGVKVAFVGINTPETPDLVFPGNLGTMAITDPTAALSAAAAAARAEGAHVVVALSHLGFSGRTNGIPGGPLLTLASTSAGVDVFYGGHTHQNFSGMVNGAAVLQTVNAGGTYTRTALCVDAASKQVIGVAGEHVTPRTAGVTPDPAIVSMLAPYRTQLTAVLDTPIGVANATFPRGVVAVPGQSANERRVEAALGNLITDAVRARYGTQLAVMNGGGIRASLPSSYRPANTALRRDAAPYVVGPPYDIVLGDIQAVLPFGNLVVTRTVTGAQLWDALENAVRNVDASSDGRFLQVSGFRFTWDKALPAGARVVSVELNDATPIPDSAAAVYTLASNDFINGGGDGFTMFADGQGATREPLLEVVADYVAGLGAPLVPSTGGRITALNLP